MQPGDLGPEEVSQVFAHFLDELFLPLLLRSGSLESHKDGVCMGRTQGTQMQKGLVQVLLSDHGGFYGILSFTLLVLR